MKKKDGTKFLRFKTIPSTVNAFFPIDFNANRHYHHQPYSFPLVLDNERSTCSRGSWQLFYFSIPNLESIDDRDMRFFALDDGNASAHNYGIHMGFATFI